MLFGIKDKLEGSIIEELNRRGKFLLFRLSSGYIFIMHLGMSGRILVTEPSRKENRIRYPHEMGAFFQKIKPTEPHDHVIIDFFDQTRITYNDPRRFGAIDIVDLAMINQHKWLSKLGPEPLSNCFSPKYWCEIIDRSLFLPNIVLNFILFFFDIFLIILYSGIFLFVIIIDFFLSSFLNKYIFDFK